MLNFINRVLWAILIIIAMLCVAFIADRITCAAERKEGVVCEKIGIITYEERFRNKGGQLVLKHNFHDIQNGDILFSNSTHSLGWRHGHAGMVVDSGNGEIIEAAIWGEPSHISKLKYWRTYGKVKHLRIKEDVAAQLLEDMNVPRDTTISPALQIGNIASEFAKKYENDVAYSLLTGMGEKNQPLDGLDETQCAYLVWHVYYNMGIDIDSDEGWLVTPNDIEGSEYLEQIEAFGYTKP